MADRNWHQQFILNPATSLQDNDLFYFPRSPYLTDGSDDFVINWQNFLLSIQTQLPGGMDWVDVVGTTQLMVPNTGYVTDNVALITFTMPATAAFGTVNQITGLSAGGWLIQLNTGQRIHFGNDEITVSTGTLFSTHDHDCVTLRCVVPDQEWVVESSQGNLSFT
jgi:hypothetical protein